MQTPVDSIKVNVIREKMSTATRELKLDEEGKMTVRLADGSIVKGTPVELLGSREDIVISHPIDEVLLLTREERILLLDEEEKAFLDAVTACPGGKHAWSGDHFRSDSGKEAVWKKPEALKLVVCVGSWKWKPTENTPNNMKQYPTWVALKHRTTKEGYYLISPYDYFIKEGSIPDGKADLELEGIDEVSDHELVARKGYVIEDQLTLHGIPILQDPIWYFDKRHPGYNENRH